MKKIYSLPLLLVLFFYTAKLAAQAFPPARHKVAVFTPLYLDSVFTPSGGYRYNKTFPKFLNPGVEFYQGAQLALDSLQKAGAPLEVYFYDSRSRYSPISQQLNSPELQNVQFINVGADFTAANVTAKMDSTRKNVCIVGSLDERFGKDLAGELASVN